MMISKGDLDDGLEEQDELSVLEYTRKHGLSCDPLAEPIPYPYTEEYRINLPNFCDDSHLLQFHITSTIDTEERMPLPKSSAQILANLSYNQGPNQFDNPLWEPKGRAGRHLYFELPLLKSYHEIDYMDFRHSRTFDLELEDLFLPLEPIDDENGGGLTLPARLWELESDILRKIELEKLEMNQAVAFSLTNALKINWTEDDEERLRESFHNFDKKLAIGPITPILSPINTAMGDYEPSVFSPTFDISLLSDPISLTGEDLHRIENKIFQDDIPTPVHGSDIDSENIFSTSSFIDMLGLEDSPVPGKILKETSTSPTTVIDSSLIVRAEDLKVEELLTPRELENSEYQKIQINGFVEEMLLDTKLSPYSNDSKNSLFKETLENVAAEANKKLMEEPFDEADTISRVKVPHMDFSKPCPPWENFRHGNGFSILTDLKEAKSNGTFGSSLQKWDGGKLTNDLLRWMPFSGDPISKITIDEEDSMDFDRSLSFLGQETFEPSSTISKLTWKPEGLKILKDCCKEDEEGGEELKLTESVSETLEYLELPIKEPKSENDAHTLIKEQIGDKLPSKGALNDLLQIRGARIREFQQSRNAKESSSLLGENAFSAERSLANFLHMRGSMKRKLSGSLCLKQDIPCKKYALQEAAISSEESIGELPLVSLPLPHTKLTSTPFSIIISSTIMRQRKLIQCISASLPSLSFVERDFSAFDTTIWIPGSVTRSPQVSPLAAEADIIMSPTAGIILTTMQQIRQKPLPGQKSKVQIRDRVERVSGKYETLIILVSETRPDESTTGITESDCLAFSEFIAFNLSLDVSIRCHIVGGGVETLSKWVASLISQLFMIAQCDVTLLEEETHWELFLRRAGMNAFAAQVVIKNLLDEACSPKVGRNSVSGLAALVMMPKEQRAWRLERVCGEKVAEQVNLAIDFHWRRAI